MNQALYNQEFECEFLEGAGSVFRGVREVAIAFENSRFPSVSFSQGRGL